MVNIEDIKNLFEKEIKKYNKKLKTVLDKYEEISQEHELLLADVEALDTRLNKVEKILKISNNDIDEEISNKTVNNIKDISEFRYQIITRTRANQLMNNRKLNQRDENEEPNFDYNINDTVVSNEKRSRKNNINYQENQKEKFENNKKTDNHSKIKGNENKYNNKFNKYNFEKKKLDNTFNGLNPSLIRDNINTNNNKDNDEIMTFKNDKMNINDSESVVSTSEHYSEFSFNPQKRKNDLIDKQKINQIQKSIRDFKSIINSDILKSFEELELIIKSIPNYNKFDDIPTIQTIFQSSLNGDSSKNFHKFCDGEPNVIVLIETDKGNRFGGFTSIGFNSDGENKKDFYAFLFSFDLMKIYKNKKGRKAIVCKENSGPWFGDKDNKDLQINDNYLRVDSFVGKASGCFSNMNIDFEINKGNSNFIINK